MYKMHKDEVGLLCILTEVGMETVNIKMMLSKMCGRSPGKKEYFNTKRILLQSKKPEPI